MAAVAAREAVMRKLKGVCVAVIALLACATSTMAGDQLVVRDLAWGEGEPLVALDPHGSGLLFIHNPRFGVRLEAGASLVAAEMKNPGLLSAFANHTLEGWVAQGVVRRDADGTFIYGSQDQFNYLNALLRSELTKELGAYLDSIHAALDEKTMLQLAWGPASVRTIDLSRVAPISKDWYERPDATVQPADATFNEFTDCIPCGGQGGGGICGVNCVDGCSPPSWDCVHIIIKPRLTDLRPR